MLMASEFAYLLIASAATPFSFSGDDVDDGGPDDDGRVTNNGFLLLPTDVGCGCARTEC